MKIEILKLTAILMTIAVCFSSCNKKVELDIDELCTCEEEQQQGYLEDVVIIANVENASKYSRATEVWWSWYDMDLRTIIKPARAEWKNGSFAIELPETLDSNYLNGSFGGSLDLLTISNRDVKTKEATFAAFENNGNYVTSLFHAKKTENGYVRAFYIYADSDATFYGSTTSGAYLTEKDNNGHCSLYLWKINTTFSVSWKKGWNIWYLSSSYSKAERIITKQWSSTPVCGLKWYGGEEFLAMDTSNRIRNGCPYIDY